MKIILFIIFVFLLFVPIRVYALKATTVKDSIACLSKEALQEMIQFAGADDKASFSAYLIEKKCIIINKEVDVTVIDSPGMLGNIAMFIFNGVKFWTTREGLKNYR